MCTTVHTAGYKQICVILNNVSIGIVSFLSVIIMDALAKPVKLGMQETYFPSDQLAVLHDSTELLHDGAALRTELDKRGYLWLRNLNAREDVLAARLAVLNYIDATGKNKLDERYPLEKGILNQNCGLGCVPHMEGKNQITHSQSVLDIIAGDKIRNVFERLIGEPVITFDYKWLRAMYHDGFTGAHVDNVYMSRGSRRLLTCWTPLGDITPDMGTLCICEGSHNLSEFSKFRTTYGELDLERKNVKGTGWFTCDPFEITQRFGGQWKTAEFQAGDVLIFTLFTVHMSTVNLTHLARISCDCRWQPASDVLDSRYMGDFAPPKQSYGVYGGALAESDVTVDKLKPSWGFS